MNTFFRFLTGWLVLGAAITAQSYETNGTKWGIGPNSASMLAGNEGTPGSFSWSIMRSGLGFMGYENHYGFRTTEFGMLLGSPSEVEEIAAITSALQKWSSVCGLTVEGLIADCGLDGGAPESLGAAVAEMRFGSVADGFGGNFLGHAYQPGNESIYGTGGSIAGDIHMNTQYNFVDAPNHVYVAGGPFDFETVMIHEIGHSLGLGHSTAPQSVMRSEYIGAKRSLMPDDIAGIQFIYGPVPEPASVVVIGLGFVALLRRRRAKN